MPNRRAIALTLAAIAAITIPIAAPARAVSGATTLDLSGRDAANPDNEAQVQAGGTVDWVTTYDTAAGAPSEVRIDQAFSDGQAVVPGSLQVPAG